MTGTSSITPIGLKALNEKESNMQIKPKFDKRWSKTTWSTPDQIEEIDGGGPTSVQESGLTIVHAFFGEEQRFRLLIDNWNRYSRSIKDKLKIIMVDDHGTPPLKSLLTPSILKRIDFDLTIYEIEDDLKHNTPGAYNLGVMAATTPWVLTLESDCTFLPGMMQKVMEYKPMKNCVYMFDRLRVTENKAWLMLDRYLPTAMLMNKEIFLDLNGFDEDFTGEYSNGYGFFDTHFTFKVMVSKWDVGIAQPNIIATEWMPDTCGERVPRTDEGIRTNKKLFYSKRNGSQPLDSNKMLRFAWSKVYASME